VNVERMKAKERLEDAAMDLLYHAEQFSNTGRSMYDMKVLRRCLLESARRYGDAINALARKP